MTPTDAVLEPLGEGVGAWLQAPAGHDRPNAGVIVEDDGITVVDTLIVPSQAGPLLTEVEASGLPVRRAVYSSSHIEYVGGSTVFWKAARYGRALTSALLDRPANPATLQALHPALADELAEPATRPVSHVVDTSAWLTTAVCAIPTAGQQRENLVALVPSADVLFAGAMCCFGVTPNAFDGDPLAWAEALGELAELAGTIVPGIGPVGSADDVLALQAYLWACADAEGDVGGIPEGPWDAWPDRHLDAVNVQRAAMLAAGDDGVPPAMLALVGLA